MKHCRSHFLNIEHKTTITSNTDNLLINGNITGTSVSSTSLTPNTVPYVDANGKLTSMPDVTFNPTTNALHVTTLASPSIPQATVFKGSVNAVNNTAPTAADGQVYSNTTSGFAGSSWTGISGLQVEANQLLFYADNQWERGGIEEVSNLVTLSSPQTISAEKTFSAATTAFTNAITVGTTSTHNDTATFTKSNGRAIEVKTGSALNGYWTGSGDITAKSFKQSGSTSTNSFTGAITTSKSLSVGSTSSFGGTVTVGTGSSAASITTGGAIQGQSITVSRTLTDMMQLTNLTGLSQFPGTPVVGDVAMFAGILYYYGAGNAWYRFGTTAANPPS